MRVPWNSVTRTAGVAAAALLFSAVAVSPAMAQGGGPDDRGRGDDSGSRHVLLISVDGLHQADLSWYVGQHPGSALAALARSGVDYTNASTPVPSDSFPGLIAQVTGGNPATTGIYYDSSYNRGLLPAGTTTCGPGATTGADVEYSEAADKNPLALDAGQGLAGLPGRILSLTGQPRSLIDPATLPVDPATCTPVYPHQYLAVNTVFEVARAHRLRTAWADKHPAYEIVNGPSGAGVQDLFTPEINSQADGLPAGKDWTKDNLKTQQYDGYKAHAVRNELDGLDHSGTTRVGVPAILGMNFQAVSTAQKLPTSGGLAGGYLADGVTPGPVLSAALDFVDGQLGSFVHEIDAQHLTERTTIIVSAKHAQSPTDPATLTRIDDGPIIDGLNTAWTALHPGAGPLVVHAADDDAMLLWLRDHSQAAADFARTYLLGQSGTGNTVTGAPRAYTSAGLTTVLAGRSVTRYFHAERGDQRVPDILGIAAHGVVYTGGKGKIAEHGGADPQDRNVPILVAGPDAAHGRTIDAAVQTTQIAPTILRALGLNPRELQAVRIERTRPLQS